MTDVATKEHDELTPIREAVRALCAEFPGEYWRKLDRERAYPSEFVAALTKAGFLAALIPEGIRRLRPHHVGGGRDPGGNPSRRLQRRRLPRPDVHHGHGAAARQRRAEGEISARHRQGRAAAAGLRRHRADLGHRHAAPAHHRGARGQRRLRRQRPEDLDLARRAFRPDAAARAHHAARPGQEAHRRPVGVPGRHARGERQGPDHPADPHHDEPRHHRSVLRQHAGAGGEPDRRGGQGLPLHPVRHERRAHPDRGRVHRRRQMVHRQGHRLRQGARGVRPADRPEPGRAVSDRALPTCRCAPPS